VGISLDGPEKYHNAFRKNKTGKGTFQEAMRGFHLLRQYGITTEVLCVVNSSNANHPTEVYELFRQLQVRYITFIPLVEQKTYSIGGVTSESVDPEKFGRFMISVFDQWLQNDVGRIKIQLIEEALLTAFNREQNLCIFKKECGGVPVVEYNGDFYSCDHYVNPLNRLGNLKEHSLVWYLNSPVQQAFGKAKQETLPQYCLQCPVLDMCNGECPKNRIIKTPDGQTGLNFLCKGYKLFFAHIQPFIETVRQLNSQEI
jgi:uncharacterized protein